MTHSKSLLLSDDKHLGLPTTGEVQPWASIYNAGDHFSLTQINYKDCNVSLKTPAVLAQEH